MLLGRGSLGLVSGRMYSSLVHCGVSVNDVANQGGVFVGGGGGGLGLLGLAVQGCVAIGFGGEV